MLPFWVTLLNQLPKFAETSYLISRAASGLAIKFSLVITHTPGGPELPCQQPVMKSIPNGGAGVSAGIIIIN